MAFYCELMDRASLLNVNWHPYKLLCDEFDLWNRQDDLIESLERNRKMVTVWLWASDSAFKLSMHEINYNGLRPFQMSLPGFDTSPFIILAMGLNHGHQWLDLYPVQIFMKGVEHNIEELLRILLLLCGKLLFEPSQNPLKVDWNDYGRFTKPHFLD